MCELGRSGVVLGISWLEFGFGGVEGGENIKGCVGP